MAVKVHLGKCERDFDAVIIYLSQYMKKKAHNKHKDYVHSPGEAHKDTEDQQNPWQY